MSESKIEQKGIEMAKHTPGPWHAAHVGESGRDSESVYDICDDHNWRLAQYANEANARLIAAAPELLEALQNLLTPHAVYRTRELIQAGRAAITKATRAD